MLHAGHKGAFAWLLLAVSGKDGSPHEAAYFWLTGLLSAVLDNASTYLAFFELAGGMRRSLWVRWPAHSHQSLWAPSIRAP